MSATYAMTPIGYVRSAFVDKFSTPRQPFVISATNAEIELVGGQNFETALCDLTTFSHIWVLFVFHHNHTWHPKVMPPVGSSTRRGVFATRAPHRPNPLGMSVVELVAVSGRTLTVAGLDALDGTPVLDIKPYVALADKIDAANNGWLDHAEQQAQATYTVVFAPLALEQLAWWYEQTGENLRPRLERALATGPRPHEQRHLRGGQAGAHVLSLPSWRIDINVTNDQVLVVTLRSAHTAEHFAHDPSLVHHERYQRTFAARSSASDPRTTE